MAGQRVVFVQTARNILGLYLLYLEIFFSQESYSRKVPEPQEEKHLVKNGHTEEVGEEFEMAKLIKKKAKLLKKEAKKAKKKQSLSEVRQFTEWQSPLCEWLKPLGEWQSPLSEWQQPLSEWYVPSGSSQDRENKKQEEVIQF